MGNWLFKSGLLDRLIPRFEIVVKTGQYKGSGTDANVYIRFHDGKNELQSKDIKLDNRFKNDLERGQTDVFYSKLDDVDEGFAEITKIELWMDESGVGSSWFCEVIIIKDRKLQQEYPFPVLRWMKANYHYQMEVYDTCLPQDSIDPQRRQTELEEARTLYELYQKGPGLPLQLKAIPDDEQFTSDYKDMLKGTVDGLKFETLLQMLKLPGTWKSVDDFALIYTETKKHGYPFPTSMARWKNHDKDEIFGAQRLIGCNPQMIMLATTIPDKFAVTDDMMQPFLEGMTLKDAQELKKLFLVDFDILNNLQYKHGDLEMCSPIGLFYLNKNNKLLPVAIQLQQKPAANNPVFLPSDPEHTWAMAKLWFTMADGSLHQPLKHLCNTHLAMEGFAIVTKRQLNRSHPINRLLSPHFYNLLSINTNGIPALLVPGGHLDRTLNIGSKGALEIVERAWKQWRFDVDCNPEEEFKSRGVDDPAVLPVYPYRDDSLQIYHAIKTYVSDILRLYYDSPEKINGDSELKNWGAEIVASVKGYKGLGIKGFPGDGKLTNVDDIINTCARIIHTCSVIHAAVNFTQYDEYAFPVNYTAYLKGKPPTDKEPLTEKDVLAALPDKKVTLGTLLITSALSTRATYNLGSWELRHQYHPEALQAEERLRKELRRISELIKIRNKREGSLYKYTTLDPLGIPNSISI